MLDKVPAQLLGLEAQRMAAVSPACGHDETTCRPECVCQLGGEGAASPIPCSDQGHTIHLMAQPADPELVGKRNSFRPKVVL